MPETILQVANPIVTLQANSLYINTRQMLNLPGKFHWALYLTDSHAKSTKFCWQEVKLAEFTGKYETLQITEVEDVQIFFANLANLTFLRLRSLTLPNLESFHRIVSEAFPEGKRLGFATMQENRQAGISSRTWVTHVIAALKTNGCLVRAESAKEIEDIVTELSIEMEDIFEEVNSPYVGDV